MNPWKEEGPDMDPRRNMRRVELMALAREQGVDVPGSATKDDILRLMNVIPTNAPEVLGMGREVSPEPPEEMPGGDSGETEDE